MKNIYQRMNAVMKEVSYVQKDSKISGGGANYKAVSHDQVVSVARAQFVEQGIVVYPEQVSAEMIQQRDLKQDVKMHLYSGMYNIHFVNIDDPADRLTVSINAHAADNGDKAPGKRASYATKTAILKALSLETGENDESREEVRDKTNLVSAQQHDQLAAYCYKTLDGGGVEWTSLGNTLKGAYTINALSSLPYSKFKEALTLCETRAAK